MQLTKVSEELHKFAKYVIQQARTELSKGKKNSSKKLYNSLDYRINEYSDSIDLLFNMEDYGAYQDLGVSGVKKKYNTVYSFKDKMPPPSSLDKWIVRRGLKDVRDEKGRFVPRKSLQYMIARSIYRDGIKPSFFFTKPFQAAFERLPDEISEAFAFSIMQDEKFFPENMNKN
tara:strand:+ start:1300 stop:1818 length:519 start_codon:yes stop_codon:yes gene_type:complete